MPDSPFRCPTCAELQLDPIDLADEALNTKGFSNGVDRVEYWPRRLMAARRLSRAEPTDFEGLKRGDLVVLQSPDQALREVKRVVGFPGEQLTIRGGDLWIGDRRWKKSIVQLLQQAVLVHANPPQRRLAPEHAESDSIDEDESPLRPCWTDGLRELSSPIRMAGGEANESLSLDAPAAVAVSEAKTRRKSLNESEQSSVSSLFFQTGDGGWIDNRFIGNLHDSHALIAPPDIGVAMQLGNWSEEWVARFAIRSPNQQWLATIDVSGTDWAISSEGKESTSLIGKADYKNEAVWLVIACVDGDGVVSLNERELFRIELEQEAVSDFETAASSNAIDSADGGIFPVEIKCLLGNLQIEQLVVLRDLHYRGSGDAPVQQFDSNEGLVLLGDNISLSNDSRQRWEEGIDLSGVAGVIDESRSGIESLLRQREGMPKPTRER